METVKEEAEVYERKDVQLPSLSPKASEPELGRETGERRRGRNILIAVDHGPNSKHAFDWALAHLCRIADTIHLIHVVAGDEVDHKANENLLKNLAAEAYQVAMVRSVASIVEGDAGKAICREAERLKPAAVVVGTRGRGLIQSLLQGSVSEYCFHHCKVAPVVIVPGKDVGEESAL